jgi:hypothetical protein
MPTYQEMSLEQQIPILEQEQLNVRLLTAKGTMWTTAQGRLDESGRSIGQETDRLEPAWTDPAGTGFVAHARNSKRVVDTWAHNIADANPQGTLDSIAGLIPSALSTAQKNKAAFDQYWAQLGLNPTGPGMSKEEAEAPYRLPSGLLMNQIADLYTQAGDAVDKATSGGNYEGLNSALGQGGANPRVGGGGGGGGGGDTGLTGGAPTGTPAVSADLAAATAGIDPATGLPIDARTGLPIDPATGLPVDPRTGLPIDPATGLPVDPQTGLPVGAGGGADVSGFDAAGIDGGGGGGGGGTPNPELSGGLGAAPITPPPVTSPIGGAGIPGGGIGGLGPIPPVAPIGGTGIGGLGSGGARPGVGGLGPIPPVGPVGPVGGGGLGPIGGIGPVGGGVGPVGGGGVKVPGVSLGGGVGGGGGGTIPSAATPYQPPTSAGPSGAAPGLSSAAGGTAGGSGAGGVPPMMPPMGMGGAGAGGGPGAGTTARSGGNNKNRRKEVVTPGLPVMLSGKAGQPDLGAFAGRGRRQVAESDVPTTVQLIDEDLWQVEQKPVDEQVAAPIRRAH